MSGPIVQAVTEAVHLGCDEIWPGGNDTSRIYGNQSRYAPAEYATWMDWYVMKQCAHGRQNLLAEWPE